MAASDYLRERKIPEKAVRRARVGVRSSHYKKNGLLRRTTFVTQPLHFVTRVIRWRTWFHHIKLVTKCYSDEFFRHRVILYNQIDKTIGDTHVSSLNVFVTKDFICWRNISSTNNFIFIFIFLLRHGVTIVFRQLMFSSPKDLCGDEILRHQLFFIFLLFLFY